MHRWNVKAHLCAWSAVLLLAACATPAPQDSPQIAENRQLTLAERQTREGDHAAAAHTYEQLAAQSSGELRDRFLLRAAQARLQANDAPAARKLLGSVTSALPHADQVLKTQVAAELALQANRPEEALAELNRLRQPPPREAAEQLLALRARALFAAGRPAAAVSVALERERALASAEAVRANHRLIWNGLQQSAAANADFTPPTGAHSTLSGWLELGRTALQARNPFTAEDALAQWRARYPTHPAHALLTEEVQPQLGMGLDYPAQVALVLPLSGRQQAAAVAVRDGFLAALLQQPQQARPVVNVYDSADVGALTAYRSAVADGAQFIVGPLTKDEVAAIASSGEASVLTLALNQLSDGVQPPPMLFQFALNPEEEARQAAQRIVADGRMRGVVLLPNNEWGRRLFNAFDNEMKTLGGSIGSMRFYDPTERDYSGPIRAALLIDESRARANALSAALGARFEFEPRRRGDVQFVFVGAQPVQGRSLRPALRFHLGDDLPVYATSDIFEPDVPANDDLEGVLFADMPWVISPDASAAALRAALTKHWPVRARGRGRLYAFGFDAYRLIPLLKAGRFGREHAIPGMTGLLSLDQNGAVRRELEWARVVEGRAQPLAQPPLSRTDESSQP